MPDPKKLLLFGPFAAFGLLIIGPLLLWALDVGAALFWIQAALVGFALLFLFAPPLFVGGERREAWARDLFGRSGMIMFGGLFLVDMLSSSESTPWFGLGLMIVLISSSATELWQRGGMPDDQSEEKPIRPNGVPGIFYSFFPWAALVSVFLATATSPWHDVRADFRILGASLLLLFGFVARWMLEEQNVLPMARGIENEKLIYRVLVFAAHLAIPAALFIPFENKSNNLVLMFALWGLTIGAMFFVSRQFGQPLPGRSETVHEIGGES